MFQCDGGDVYVCANFTQSIRVRVWWVRECFCGCGRREGGAGAIRQPCTGFLAKGLWKKEGSIARSWRTAGRDSRKYSGGFQQGARHTSKIAIREATSHHKETPGWGCLAGPADVGVK